MTARRVGRKADERTIYRTFRAWWKANYIDQAWDMRWDGGGILRTWCKLAYNDGRAAGEKARPRSKGRSK